MKMGYSPSSEEHGPAALLDEAGLAVQQIGGDDKEFFKTFAGEVQPRFENESCGAGRSILGVDRRTPEGR